MANTATILIIEDQTTEARFFEDALTRAGYSVLGTASSGEKAMKPAETNNTDLILAGIAIKGPMDGIEVSQITAAQSGAGIIYLSGFSDLPYLERAKLTEPFGHLVKPVELRDLASTIAMQIFYSESAF
jgi:DNA-binding NtrC family response regulator